MSKNVFISWSGELSKSLAIATRDWIGNVIQAADPFVSEKDIDAGDRGLSEIAGQLSNIKVGILCLTSDNHSSPWLNFEAGALSREISENTRVIPLSFDVPKARIPQPIGQFQAKDFSKEDLLAVARSVNRALESPLLDHKLVSAFNAHWESFDQAISSPRSSLSNAKGQTLEQRSDSDMLNEIVETLRDQHNAILTINRRFGAGRTFIEQSSLADHALVTLAGYHNDGKKWTAKGLVDAINGEGIELDGQDWGIVRSAPFLYWYLTQYHVIQDPFDRQGPNKPIEVSSTMNDVPF